MEVWQVNDAGVLRNFGTKKAAESTGLPATAVTLPDGVLRRELGTGEIVDLTQGELDGAIAKQLSELAVRKQAEIEAAYKAAYSANLVSSALGSPHTYITDEEGEKHLMGWAACKRPRNVWCDDGTGYGWRLHTAAQTEQVLNDGADIKEAAWNNRIAKLAEVSTILADQVLTNAEKVAAIEAVTW